MLTPSHFARPARSCGVCAVEIGFAAARPREAGSARVLLEHQSALLYQSIAYVQSSTSVDSPIEHALRARKGVCQDYAHIMITLVRQLGIPGALRQRLSVSPLGRQTRVRRRRHARLGGGAGAGLGWVGFDPTNNVLATDRHVRTAVGRDYADVPPSRACTKAP